MAGGYAQWAERGPFFPYASTNSSDLSTFREQGVRINPATNAMTATAGDPRAFVVGGDLWSFDSPVLEFRYVEKGGPEIVEAAVFGYHADLNQNAGWRWSGSK